MSDIFTHQGNTLTYEGGFPEASSLLWCLALKWEEFHRKFNNWDQVREFPTSDLLLQGFQHPEHISNALSWVERILASGSAKDYLTWETTCALQEGASSFPEENQRDLAEELSTQILHPKVHRLSKGEMKEFVMGVADGRVWSTAHMTPAEMEMVNLVFMPLSLGAFAVPPYALPPEPKVPQKPPHPEKPKYPEMPQKPELPEKPKNKEPDEEHIRDIEMAIRWHRMVPEALEHYKNQLEEGNRQRQVEWLAACQLIEKDHQESLVPWKSQVEAIDTTYQETLRAHEAILDTWEEYHAEALRIRSEWEEMSRNQFLAHVSQIGVIWEWYQHAGPRAINGMPIFYSLRAMHKDDWERCRHAICKEQGRRAAMDDLFDDTEEVSISE